MTYYTFTNINGPTPPVLRGEFTKAQVLKQISSFFAWNSTPQRLTDDAKMAYYNKHSFYRIHKHSN